VRCTRKDLPDKDWRPAGADPPGNRSIGPGQDREVAAAASINCSIDSTAAAGMYLCVHWSRRR
jgi:hypothetical protein